MAQIDEVFEFYITIYTSGLKVIASTFFLELGNTVAGYLSLVLKVRLS